MRITQAMLDVAEEAAWQFTARELQSLLSMYETWPDYSLQELRDAFYAKWRANPKDAAIHITLREIDAVLAVRRLLSAKKQDWSPRPRHRKEEPR